jgi:polysaccharide biosynthesis transport protein
MLSSEDDIRLIGITSTVQGEGKSFLTYLYSKELSRLGKRVLVIDANLSLPSLHHCFGVANGLGFFNLLSDGSNQLSDFIQSLSTNLHLITAGSTSINLMSLLCSEQFSHLIEQIRISTDYDCVLFDLPPALELSEPLLISEKLDAILFLVSLEYVRRELPEQALNRIRSTGTKVLGIATTSLRPAPGSTLSILEHVKGLKSGFNQRQIRKIWRGVTPKST